MYGAEHPEQNEFYRFPTAYLCDKHFKVICKKVIIYGDVKLHTITGGVYKNSFEKINDKFSEITSIGIDYDPNHYDDEFFR